MKIMCSVYRLFMLNHSFLNFNEHEKHQFVNFAGLIFAVKKC